MAKDSKGHGSERRGSSLTRPATKTGAGGKKTQTFDLPALASHFSKEPSITDQIKAHEKKIGRGTQEGYESAKKNGDRVAMAAHSNLLSRQRQRAADTKQARSINARGDTFKPRKGK